MHFLRAFLKRILSFDWGFIFNLEIASDIFAYTFSYIFQSGLSFGIDRNFSQFSQVTNLLLIVCKELFFEFGGQNNSLHFNMRFYICQFEVQLMLIHIGELLLQILFEAQVYLIGLLSLLSYLCDKFNLFEEDLALPQSFLYLLLLLFEVFFFLLQRFTFFLLHFFLDWLFFAYRSLHSRWQTLLSKRLLGLSLELLHVCSIQFALMLLKMGIEFRLSVKEFVTDVAFDQSQWGCFFYNDFAYPFLFQHF